MSNYINNILIKYVKNQNGQRYFIGNGNDQNAYQATTALAQACNCYREDDNEEVFSEDDSSCLNCRYRRWTASGFSCFKDFPVS